MKIKLLKYESYLQMIKNSVGTKMFRNLYLEKDGRKIDATKNGELSCAYFVSNVLSIWGMIEEGHATIKRTIEDMEKSEWEKISKKKIKPGDVIVWEEKVFNNHEKHCHMGFYIGNKRAISYSHRAKVPTAHVWDYNDKRKIIAVYRWSNF